MSIEVFNLPANLLTNLRISFLQDLLTRFDIVELDGFPIHKILFRRMKCVPIEIKLARIEVAQRIFSAIEWGNNLSIHDRFNFLWRGEDIHVGTEIHTLEMKAN